MMKLKGLSLRVLSSFEWCNQGDILRVPALRQSEGECVGMNPKLRPNHRLYIEILRRMSPEKRLLKSFELSSFSRQLFAHGMKKQYPDCSEEELSRFIKDRLDKCHNRNY